MLVVQGGPGTGKTVVALHRAAYLLYTHRFPLEGQGVLVVGPNRLFLSYIEQVLPSLGEAGVELAVTADLIDPVSVKGVDAEDVARVKGDPRMVEVVAHAVHDRERRLRGTLHVPYGLQTLHLDVARSASIVREAKRRFRTHNAARRFIERAVFEALAASARTPVEADDVADRLQRDAQVREALEWMWPLLTPAELLHDLYGSRALLRLAASHHLTEAEWSSLLRGRSEHVRAVVWTQDDVPLLDEAATVLGPLPAVRARLRPDGSSAGEIRTYGHIVVDEAQDLSPMQLRMLRRRSLNGSMTVVGDIAQATGAWSHEDWHEVLDHLPDRRGHRLEELTVGYRIPGPMMTLANRVLAAVAPDLSPPQAVRTTGDAPTLVRAEAEPVGRVGGRAGQGGGRVGRTGQRRGDLPVVAGRRARRRPRRARGRARARHDRRTRAPGHGAAGAPRQGARARRHRGRRAAAHHRRGTPGDASALCGVHAGHQAPRGGPRRAAARDPRRVADRQPVKVGVAATGVAGAAGAGRPGWALPASFGSVTPMASA